MPQIARIPAGLLSLVGAQNFGESPSELASTVVPTTDLLDQYIAGQMLHGFALFTPALGFVLQDAPALPGEVTVSVPPGEIWWLEHVSLRLNPAAGISYRGQIMLREDPSQFTALSDMIPTAVANPQHVILRGNARIWLTAGCVLAANYDTVAGAPGVGTSLMTLRYARFKA